ncbi:MAG: tetratricopeptide repeat protein [Gemmatimonadetes bacterium]|nr:tetratricopeptide repeat protein [Gemmatimonadota bacterium]
MNKGFLEELLRRRMPQIVGLYLAAGWGLLEFTDWATGRFGLSAFWEDSVVVSWALLLPVVAGLAWRWGAPGSSPLPRPFLRPPDRSVAVLPFLNMSGDPENDYLGDGLSEEVINALVKVPDLRVVSRTSAFTYKGTAKKIRTIGRELNVGSVLEGSIQRFGNRIRVTTQLVSVEDGYHLWSERFDKEMEDLFDIEDQIAEQVARALRVILKNEEWKSPHRAHPSDIRAYEYCLRGQQFLIHPRLKSLGFARQMFDKALDVDPRYAPAWAGAAESAALIHMNYPLRDQELEDADRLSQRAVELGPTLADAHSARGFALFLLHRVEESEAAFQRSLELDPLLFQAHYFHARACYQQGRLEEAADKFQKASEIREDYQAAFLAAQSSEALGRTEEAEARRIRALAVAEKHMELNPDDPRAATMRAVSLCRLGRPDEGLHWAEKALEIDPNDPGVRYNVACLYSLEGKVEEAIQCLEAAVKAGFQNKDWFRHDPDLDPLRTHPRFQSLISEL